MTLDSNFAAYLVQFLAEALLNKSFFLISLALEQWVSVIHVMFFSQEPSQFSSS